jgi:hypothetical protein
MGMKMKIALALLTVLLAGSTGAVQDKKPANHNSSLSKAIAFVKSKYKSSGLAGHVYAGFMFMMEGNSGAELADCVAWACRGIKQKGFNGNWYLSMCMYFLAEYAMKYGLTPEIQSAFNDGLKIAAEQQEETGGWCHHKEMWKESGYNKKGGGRDLGTVTSMIVGAFFIMKSLGVDPGSLLEKASKNLDSISDGRGGFTYGTDNRWHDVDGSRGANVLVGLLATRKTDHPWYGKIVESINARYTKCKDGHAFAPLHYFAVAAAMHRLGPGEYAKFYNHYVPILSADQKDDGSVPMQSDGGKRKDADRFMDSVASTAVYACILMMQKDGTFVPKKAGKPMAGGNKPADGSSPFSKKPADEKKPNQSTGGAPVAKKEEEPAMPKPYIPEDFKDSAQPDPEGVGGGVGPEDPDK